MDAKSLTSETFISSLERAGGSLDEREMERRLGPEWRDGSIYGLVYAFLQLVLLPQLETVAEDRDERLLERLFDLAESMLGSGDALLVDAAEIELGEGLAGRVEQIRPWAGPALLALATTVRDWEP